jgi:hypothetical protein
MSLRESRGEVGGLLQQSESAEPLGGSVFRDRPFELPVGQVFHELEDEAGDQTLSSESRGPEFRDRYFNGSGYAFKIKQLLQAAAGVLFRQELFYADHFHLGCTHDVLPCFHEPILPLRHECGIITAVIFQQGQYSYATLSRI